MKPKKLLKNLYQVTILTILICIVAVSVSFTADSQNQMRQWHTNEVLTVIDGWLVEFESADESDRNYKVNTFRAISDYQMQISDHAMHSDIIDSEFIVIMEHIIDSFFDNYISMIDEIVDEIAKNYEEVNEYISNMSADINKISDLFIFTDSDPADDGFNYDEQIDEDFTDGDLDDDGFFDEKLTKKDLYKELLDLYAVFMADDLIQLNLAKKDENVDKLSEIKDLIIYEDIIDEVRITALHDIINSQIELYMDTDQMVTVEVSNIIIMFDIELLLQRLWFEEHYFWLVEEIADTDREDEYDDVTVNRQIEDLITVTQLIEDDGIAGEEFILSISKRVNQLIEEYENELILIAERINQRNIEAEKAAKAAAEAAAAAAAAAARRNNNTASSSSNNNRTGTSNSNSSTNSSGSSNSSSSGTQNASGSANQSGTNSTPAAGNNRYPSITSNCRELLARLVKLEASGEGADGKQAVAEVVLNRMVSSRWSHANTVEEVVFDTKWGVQFTVKDLIWTERGAPSSSDYAAVDRALGGSNVLTRDYVFFAGTPRTQIDIIWIGNHAFSK